MYLVPKVSEICTRRLDAGLSQHSLSRTAGLGGQAINRIESGETSSVHPLRAREIAKALHCKVEDIFIVKKEHEIGTERKLCRNCPHGAVRRE